MKPEIKYLGSLKVSPKDIIMDDQVIREQSVLDIVKSLRRGTGIINPPTVTRLSNGKLQIVAGRHRVHAAIRVKLKFVLVQVVEADEAGLALIQFDENIVRNHLTPSDAAGLVSQRDAVLTKSGVASKALRDEMIGTEMGMSARSARRLRKWTEVLGFETLAKLAHTSLDSGVQYNALIALDTKTRKELIDKAIAGEDVSAAATHQQNNESEITLRAVSGFPVGLNEFCLGWRKLDKANALRALQWLRTEVGMTYVADDTDSLRNFAPAIQAVDMRAAIEHNNAQ
jgi:ParB-like chromosome segregation protein Spo0J